MVWCKRAGPLLVASLAATLAACLSTTGAGFPAAYGAPEGRDVVPRWPTTNRPLWAVDFVSASRGWAVGDHKVIIATTNAGHTWVRQGSSTTRYIGYQGVTFLNRARGWIWGPSNAAGDFVMRRTLNGGRTWRTISREGNWNGVKFVSKTVGWAVAGSEDVRPEAWHLPTYSLAKTQDGGRTWITIMSGEGMYFGDIDFVDADHGWIVGSLRIQPSEETGNNEAMVMVTTDGGATWSAPVHGATLGVGSGASTFWSVDFQSRQRGIMGGYVGQGYPDTKGLLVRTVDGGATWQAVESSRCSRIRSVSLGSAKVAWAVGDDAGRSILKTRNCGATWGTNRLPLSMVPLDVDAVSGTAAFAVGNSRDGKHARAARTTNGGRTWVRVR